jgi:RNA-directed DNA polymerase
MQKVSTKQLQIADIAKQHAGEGLTNLHQYIDAEWLEMSMKELNKKSAAGIDHTTYEEYERCKGERLPELLLQFKTGKYKAPPVRRTYIEKEDGKKRPLGIPTIEDKVLQNAVRRVVEPIYEQEFADYSYAYRTGKSAHQALERVWHEIMAKHIRYILDLDIQNFFGSMVHSHMREMLSKRVKDGVIRRQIDKWLNAGIFEEGVIKYEEDGTPQGGIISPLLSNIYLHNVADEWYKEIAPLLKGKSFMVRFADDCTLGFERKEDAQRVMKVIWKRFAKYGLTLHPEKTRLVEFKPEKGGTTFDFLGFTHYWGKSKKGKQVVKRQTSKKKLKKATQAVSTWVRENRHQKVCLLITALNRKLKGHYAYYGITHNSEGISNFFDAVCRILFKWLNRRGGKRYNWVEYVALIKQYKPLALPCIVHSYL